MAVLAAILLVVAYNMGEWHEIPKLLQADEDGHQRLARHVRADGLRRSHARGRSRDDPGGAALHPPGLGDDDGVAGHAGLRRAGRVAHPAGQDDSRRTSRSSASTVRCCSASPTSSRAITDRIAEPAADRHRAAAQHDGDRCDRAAGARGARGPAARLGPDAAALRRARAAGRADAAAPSSTSTSASGTSARTSRRRSQRAAEIHGACSCLDVGTTPGRISVGGARGLHSDSASAGLESPAYNQ